jgi:hypothetical protein
VYEVSLRVGMREGIRETQRYLIVRMRELQWDEKVIMDSLKLTKAELDQMMSSYEESD